MMATGMLGEGKISDLPPEVGAYLVQMASTLI
jgi:hypothetical protein